MLIPANGSSIAPIEDYKVIERIRGVAPPELLEYREAECPEGTELLFQDFLTLYRKRAFNEKGPLPLSYLEIQAWAFLHGVTLSSVKVDLLDALDEVYLEVYEKKAAVKLPKKK